MPRVLKIYTCLLPACGSKFSALDPRAKYCSKACRQKGHRKAHAVPLIHACKVCGEEYEAIRHDQVYCSNACVLKNRRIVAKGTLEYAPVPCEECKGDFVPRMRAQMFCARTCWLAFRGKHGWIPRAHRCTGCTRVIARGNETPPVECPHCSTPTAKTLEIAR